MPSPLHRSGCLCPCHIRAAAVLEHHTQLRLAAEAARIRAAGEIYRNTHLVGLVPRPGETPHQQSARLSYQRRLLRARDVRYCDEHSMDWVRRPRRLNPKAQAVVAAADPVFTDPEPPTAGRITHGENSNDESAECSGR